MGTGPTRALALSSLVALCLGTSQAQAQATDALPEGTGFDLHLFRHAVDSKGQFTVNGTDLLGHLEPSFGLIVDWGHNLARRGPSLTAGMGQTGTTPLVDELFTGTFHANLGLFNHLVLGVQLPLHLVTGPGYSGTDQLIGNVPGYTPQDGGLFFQGAGTLSLHAKVRILRSDRAPLGLALVLSAGFPVDRAPGNFATDPGFTVWPMLAAEWRPSRHFRLDLNVGYRYTAGRGARLVDVTWASPLTFGLGASVRLGPAVDLVAEAYGNTYSNNFFQPASTPVEAVGGLKVFVVNNSYLFLGAGRRILGADAGADLRTFIGFIFEPSIGDRDGDGYRDDVDRCPDNPEDFDGFEDQDGCPDPDNDQDGILDVDDQCPLTPEDRDGDHDEDGCPEADTSDRDGDGILDRVDQCPDNPEDRDGFQDTDGCPDPDNDQDGILDRDDLCPNDPEDRDNFEDDNGCPDPDNDHDRIPDLRDQCPNDPETYNGYQDEDGCPDQGDVVVNNREINILRPINFETNSAQILPDSMTIVQQVAGSLQNNPQLELLEIQGHADERGRMQHNIDLTRDRALSVRRALIGFGVSEERLHYAGYGPLCPVALGHAEVAWRQNRRVVFLILRTSGVSSRGRVACRRAEHLIPEDDLEFHDSNAPDNPTTPAR